MNYYYIVSFSKLDISYCIASMTSTLKLMLLAVTLIISFVARPVVMDNIGPKVVNNYRVRAIYH